MAVFHQSDVSSWARCAAQVGYARAGLPDKTNSAAAYGSVMHVALLVLERELHAGTVFEQAVDKAVATFTHYWHPANIEAVCEPVPEDGWLPGQGFASLNGKGKDTLRKYADLVRFDDGELLAQEFSFLVPIAGTWDAELGEPHQLAGSVDRLALRRHRGKPYVSVEDYKAGQDSAHLRYNLQFSAYCLASLQESFWVGNKGEPGFGATRGGELFRALEGAGRRGTWISLRQMKRMDAGWRGPVDYARFALAIEQMHASITAEIFPLSISGATCRYCSYRSICGGTGLPDAQHGAP